MSLKRSLSFFRTVKFKVSLWYAVLFILASAATFFSVYWTLESVMTRKADKELLAFSTRIERLLLRGGTEGKDEWIALDKISPQTVKAVKLAVPGIKICHARTAVEGDRAVYEIAGFANGLSYNVKASAEGDVMGVESATFRERLRLLEDEFYDEAYSSGMNRTYFLLLSPEGEILAASNPGNWPELKGAKSRPVSRIEGGVQFKTDRMKLRKHRRNTRILDREILDGHILEVGQSMLEADKALNAYLAISLSVMGGMVLMGSLAGWLIARRFMAGVERVSKAAASIGQGDFSKRVEAHGEGEEIDRLVFAFNDMIARIEKLITEMKSVSDNIAHDLRTPLTRIRGAIEVAMCGNPGSEELKEMACETVEECDRLLAMINTMLEITRTESGLQELDRGEVDLKALLSSAHELFLPLAEERGMAFSLQLPEGELKVQGDKMRLQRVVSNLLDNAIKYTPEKGDVSISAESGASFVRISVQDSGCGIPEAEQARIFERFYRCDGSRSLQGNGLGLSLVKAIVKAHGGTVELKSSPGEGSLFSITLPNAKA